MNTSDAAGSLIAKTSDVAAQDRVHGQVQGCAEKTSICKVGTNLDSGVGTNTTCQQVVLVPTSDVIGSPTTIGF